MIITNNETALRVFCQPVLSEEIGALVETLENELNYANRLGSNGIGLAAPQIGIAKHIAIIRLPKLSLNLVNAKIEKGYDQALFKDEGCLSYPGQVVDTLRYQEVYVVNNMSEPERFIATGFNAVVIAHEIDHLNQTLMFDRQAPKLMLIKSNKVGPNDPCICGKVDPLTGKIKKFKKCCGK